MSSERRTTGTGGWGSAGGLAGMVAAALMIAAGCGPRIVTIKFPDADPNTDYVVCDQRGKECRGKRLEDVPATAYEPGLDVLVPKKGTPGACPNGPRSIEVVFKGKTATVVGYECAAPPPPPQCPGPSAAAGGESEPAAGTGGTGVSLTGGLPPEPAVAPEEEEETP